MSLFDNDEIRTITAQKMMESRQQPAPVNPIGPLSPPIPQQVPSTFASLLSELGGYYDKYKQSMPKQVPRQSTDYSKYTGGFGLTEPSYDQGGLGLMGYSVQDLKKDAQGARQRVGDAIGGVFGGNSQPFNPAAWSALGGAGKTANLDSILAGGYGGGGGAIISPGMLPKDMGGLEGVAKQMSGIGKDTTDPWEMFKDTIGFGKNGVPGLPKSVSDYFGGAKGIQQGMSPTGGGTTDTPDVGDTYTKLKNKPAEATYGEDTYDPSTGQGGGPGGGGGEGGGPLSYFAPSRFGDTQSRGATPFLPQSPWMGLALGKQEAEQNALMDAANAQQATAGAQARNQLAMGGGLRSGAGERIARSNAGDLALNRQAIQGQGVINRGNIAMEGAKMDTDIGKFNIGQDTAANQFDIQNRIAERQGLNEFNKFKYGEQMKLKGGAMTAQATENAANKGKK